MQRRNVCQDLSKVSSWPVVAGLLAFATTMGCDMLPFTLQPPTQLPQSLVEAEQTTPFVMVPLNRMWVQVPGAIVATERGLVDSIEQRIGLVNQTAMAGDNYVQLRARIPQGREQGRLRYEEFMRRIGGLPAPFTAMKAGDLLTGEDALGVYLWAEQTNGGTSCVLALRRLDSGMRQMPGDTSVMDVLLRNCVNGSVEQALYPIMAENIGNYPGGSASQTTGGSRMLSPLAGPTPP
jgi:hypothetical protein